MLSNPSVELTEEDAANLYSWRHVFRHCRLAMCEWVSRLVIRESEAERRQRSHHRLLESRLQRDKEKGLLVKKILLLGDTNSGKTTIFKQMRILHMKGFTETDLVNYRFVVQKNVIAILNELVRELETTPALLLPPNLEVDVISWKAWQAAEAAQMVELDPGAALLVARLWASAQIQAVYARQRFSINLMENAKYFLDEIERIGAMDYYPNSQDILNSRQNTTAVSEIKFSYRRLTIQMVDVGGQRSERRKWIHLFDDVECVLFIAAMSDYDRQGDDQEPKNRLKSCRELLSIIATSPHFAHAAILLFLNKKDIFSDKIHHTPLSVCFSTYEGSSDLEAASSYVRERFSAQVPMDKDLYVHITTATNTANINLVFEACMDRILRENAKGAGFG